MVHGSWFMVTGSWFIVHGSWFMVTGSWFMVHGYGFRVWGSEFGVQGTVTNSTIQQLNDSTIKQINLPFLLHHTNIIIHSQYSFQLLIIFNPKLITICDKLPKFNKNVYF
jgi:hypothetical protein